MRKMKSYRKMGCIAVLGVVLFLALSMPAAASSVPNPTVTGPIPAVAPGDPSRDYPFFATDIDLASYGYIEEEFFIEGTANRYDTPAMETGTVIDSDHPYKTRIVVRRPVSPKLFNGTVILEWYNVTNRYDSENDWHQSAEHIIRTGYAWVGVSAQRNGVHGTPNGLIAWNSTRYGTLDLTVGGTITDDSLCYDIFSQAAQAVRSPLGVAPLGDLVPQRVIATGHSQSGGRLLTYHNSIQPLAGVIDGFHIRGATGSFPARTDLSVKVFVTESESDLFGTNGLRLRQPDTDHYRIWEVVGTSHGDWQGHVIGRGPVLLRDLGIETTDPCDLKPARSKMPFFHALNAAYDHLTRWIADGTPPPIGTPITIESVDPPVIARDGFGNALGGIRLPQAAVPTALNTGENSGPGLCRIRGRTVPFDDETLAALYRNHGAYVSAFDQAVQDNVKAGFLLEENAQTDRYQAAHSDIPPKQD